MTSNVFTKDEILQNLSSNGYLIDISSLDNLFRELRVESIFEDDEGNEFFDKNTLELLAGHLSSANKKKKQSDLLIEPNTEPKIVPRIEPKPKTYNPHSGILAAAMKSVDKEIYPEAGQQIENFEKEDAKFQDSALKENIAQQDAFPSFESDSSSFSDNTLNEDFTSFKPKKKYNSFAAFDLNNKQEEQGNNFEAPQTSELKEDFFSQANNSSFENSPVNQDISQEFQPNFDDTNNLNNYQISDNNVDIDDASDFDDMSLLSESIEAQEKLREYVVSELSKKNLDVIPKSNEFKLDISERTISMVAKTMAKKIAKHISAIVSQDAKASIKLAEVQEINKKLENRAKDLETQNKKLRLLLAESNRNLNSYKPSLFGLYKKVDPNKK